MIVEKQFIGTDNERLAIIRIGPNSSIPGRILFLHGAGFAHKGLSRPLATALSERGLASIAFDFSGHGESSHNSPSSLAKRISEARCVVNFLKEPIDTLCAFSMGGYIALHLLHFLPIRQLILFAPAIYHKRAMHVAFGAQFSRVIRQHKSWLKSDSETLLSSYRGKLLIFIGEADETIPFEVVTLLLTHTTQAEEKKVMVLPNVGHRIARAMSEDTVLCKYITQEILKFIDYIIPALE